MNFKYLKLYSIGVYILWVILASAICFMVPSDSEQGVAQRIFYFHVPTAWTSFIALGIGFYYSITYLRKREILYDIMAFSYVKIGWVFTTGVLITGPLWAKPIWGIYWNWSDQRLLTFFILWLIFTAYLILRSNIPDIHKKARLSAVLCILGFIDIPLVYLSIRIWKTPSHPGPVVGGSESSGIEDPVMRITLWFSFICFLLLMYLLARVQINQSFIKHTLLEKLSIRSLKNISKYSKKILK